MNNKNESQTEEELEAEDYADWLKHLAENEKTSELTAMIDERLRMRGIGSMKMDRKIEIATEYMKNAEPKKRNGPYVSPTEIGAIINGGHSSVGSPVCLEMVRRGIAERSEYGWYRLI